MKMKNLLWFTRWIFLLALCFSCKSETLICLKASDNPYQCHDELELPLNLSQEFVANNEI